MKKLIFEDFTSKEVFFIAVVVPINSFIRVFNRNVG